MAVLPVIERLPPDYLFGVGLVVTTWSKLEREIRQTVFVALGLGPKHGRTAVRTARSSEMVQTLSELLYIDGITTDADLTMMAKSVGDLESKRDLIAHSAWLKGPEGQIYIQDLSGKWKPFKNEPSVKRRIHPEAIEVSADDLASIAALIESVLVIARAVRSDVAKQYQALRRTQRTPPAQDPLPGAQDPTTP